MNFFVRFFHRVFGWHWPAKERTFDGCSIGSQCRYCGRKILLDSQGNWFAI